MKWKKTCVRRLCCLLPGQVVPSCAWCRMCCALTLCSATGIIPLALGHSPWHQKCSKYRHKPLTFLLLGCLLLFSFPFLAIFCPSQLLCQLCRLPGLSEGSVSLCFHSATCREFTLGMLGSAVVSAPAVSLGLCHLGCAFPPTPTLLLVPSCIARF